MNEQYNTEEMTKMVRWNNDAQDFDSVSIYRSRYTNGCYDVTVFEDNSEILSELFESTGGETISNRFYRQMIGLYYTKGYR